MVGQTWKEEWLASMHTEIGPILATAVWRAFSSLFGISTYPVSVAPEHEAL